jgi:uncharacterized protein with von Willebrand factor type A (vWA) domain
MNRNDVVLLGRALREHGVAVTPSEAIAAVTAFQIVDQTDREEVFLALRSVFASRAEDFAIFKELFDKFWQGSIEHEISTASLLTRPGPTRRGLAFFLENWATSGGKEEAAGEPLKVPGASEIESNREKDFGAFGKEDLDEVARLARRMVRRLANNPSRRWRPVRRGSRINLRRSLRQSLKTGGEIVELSYKERKPKRTKLIVICDVSGSMDIYSRLLLQFIYGLQNSFARVESFVFATSLSRITGYLKNKTYERALERLSSKVHGWSGGTRIGESLAAFNADWLRRVDKRTVVIILSDGWDTGEPQQLATALSQLQQRTGRLIWLNPLLGSSSYEPLTRGMQAALSHIDVFAPAHDLASLRALEPHLVL